MGVTRWQLKIKARTTLGKSPKPFLTIGGTLLGLLTLTYLIQTFVGGLMVYLPLSLADFPMQTGVWEADAALMGSLLSLGGLGRLSTTGGLLIALRMDVAGAVMVLLMPWSLLGSFLCIQLILLLVTSPFRLGALDQFWRMIAGEELQPGRPFHWYADLRLTGKALCVELVLGLWKWLTRMLFLVPGMALMVAGSQGQGNTALLGLALLLTLAGPVLGYWLYCLLLPARYVLAKHPQRSPWQAFRRGAGLFKGRRKDLFLFRLSFLPWNLVSMFMSGLPDAFIYPYEEMSCMLLIESLLGPEAMEG